MAQVYAEIALSNVGMVYKTEGSDVTALTGVTFDIQKGEFISLLGPSGCGKTTLLRIIAGLLENTDGTAIVAGMTPTQARQAGRDGHGVPERGALRLAHGVKECNAPHGDQRPEQR